MTPPTRIQNFFLGSLHSDPLQASDGGEPDRSLRRMGASRDGREGWELMLLEAESRFLFNHAARYGAEVRQPIEGIPPAELAATTRELLGEARRGNRRNYFLFLRNSYGLLATSPEAARPRILRDLLGATEEYSQFLRNAPDLNDLERLRYLWAASRFIHSSLSFLQQHPEPAAADSFETLFTQMLNRLDSEMLDYYYQGIDGTALERERGLGGILRQIELRQAVLNRNPLAEREASRELSRFLQGFTPGAEPRTWGELSTQFLLEDPGFLDNLTAFDRPSAAEENAVHLNSVTLDLALVMAAALDQVNGESDQLIRNRYAALSAVLTALVLMQPGRDISDWLEILADPRRNSEVRAWVEQANQNFAQISQLMNEARGDTGRADLISRARGAALHLQSLASGPGRDLLPPLFNQNRRLHPIRQLAAELRTQMPLRIRLGLPATLSLDPEDSLAQAIELLRRREAGVESLENYQDEYPGENTGRILALLREQLSAEDLPDRLLQARIESFQERLDAGEDHEVAAIHAALAALKQNREAYSSIGVAARTLQEAENLRERIEGIGFRSRQVVRHLFSSNSLLTLGAGILLTEFLPTLYILRAGAGGRLISPLLGEVVSGGQLTLRGLALTGVLSGLTISTLGTALHSQERTSQGLRPLSLGDLGSGILVNTATFGFTLPFSRLLANRLAAGALRSSGVPQLRGLRAFGLHSATVGFAATLGLGMGCTLRGIRTGHFETSWDEVAENYGSIMMWEAGSSGLRWARSRGLDPTLRPASPPPAFPEGPRGELQRRLFQAQSLVRRHGARFWSGLGEHRAGQVSRLAVQLGLANQGFRADPQRWIAQLSRREIRQPGYLAQLEAALGRGMFPVLSGSRGDFLLIPREHLTPSGSTAAPESNTSLVRRLDETLSGLDRSAARETLPPEALPAIAVDTNTEQLPETTFFLNVPFQTPGEGAGILNFGPAMEQASAPGTWSFGRADFSFLPAPVRRIISRAHFQIQLNPDGTLTLGDLSNQGRRSVGDTPASRLELGNNFGTWVRRIEVGENPGPWQMINPDQPQPIRPGDRIALGQMQPEAPADPLSFRSQDYVEMVFGTRRLPDPAPPVPVDSTEPNAGRPPQADAPTVQPPAARTQTTVALTHVALEPGKRLNLGGLRLIRDREQSIFRLAGPADTLIELRRQYAEGQSQHQTVSAVDNPVIGEIGETVELAILRGGSRREFRLLLDDTQSSASRIPVVSLRSGSEIRRRPFRSTSPEINFGRLYDPDFLTADWISRNAFSVKIIPSREASPRYRLEVHARNGLRLGEFSMTKGESIDLDPGDHSISFYMRPNGPLDGPHQLSLPAIETAFPEWGIGTARPQRSLWRRARGLQ